MKDAEFIELLNLYLDHEISAADAARLEAEVQRHPARRQIYRQYCQMQKACTMLSADFVAAKEEKKIIAFEPRRPAWRPAVWGLAGLAAAAACAAFVLFNRNSAVAPAGQSVVAAYTPTVVDPQVPPTAADLDTRSIARTVTVAARRTELQPVLTANALAFGGNQTVALAPTELDWIRNVKLAPMQIAPVANELRFENHPALKSGPAVYRSSRPIQGTVEMTAFQFQK